jgi:hypothetical protein
MRVGLALRMTSQRGGSGRVSATMPRTASPIIDPAVAGGEVAGGGTGLDVVADGTFAASTGNVITHSHSSHNRPADIIEDDVGAANVTTGNRCHTSIPGGLCRHC